MGLKGLPFCPVCWLLGWLRPRFLWKGEGTGNIREKIVVFVYGGELLCQKFRWNLLLEIKWKFHGGGRDGVSVLGGQ